MQVSDSKVSDITSVKKTSPTVCLSTFGNKFKQCGCQQDKLETWIEKRYRRQIETMF